MTAKTVNGVEVVGDEPAMAPLPWDMDGPKYTSKSARQLLLADGSIVFGCAEPGCDFTGETVFAIRPHQSKHNRRERTKGVQTNPRSVYSMSVAEVIEMARALEHFIADRDRWKDRVLKAERQLAGFRSALRGLQ